MTFYTKIQDHGSPSARLSKPCHISTGATSPISQFIRACRRAKDILPPSSERNLTRLLLTKLRGRAACAVEDEICETITQLADLLNGAFGSPKTIDQYRGELSTIYLKPNEHILDYITRAKDLRSSILDSERRERGLTNNSMAEIDALTARSFCDGLPLSYRLQLTKELYIDPFAAFSHVKILAKRQELDNERFNPARRNEPIYERNGNAYRPSRPADEPRAGRQHEMNRPVRAITAEQEKEPLESQS
ncbi:hypothetical protein ACFW04_012256 [Cataglyphis niger]